MDALATAAAALVQLGPLSRMRGAARWAPALSAAILLASGAYVSYYWLTVGGAISGLLGVAGAG